MKRNKIFIFYLLSICLLISFSLSQNNLDFNYTNSANVREIDENTKNLKNAGFWNLTSPIEIDNMGVKNWTWAEGEAWLGGGNGTQSNPYIIENVTVDVNKNSDFCISIMNSNVYFSINNCTVSKASITGILIKNVSNSIIVNNTAFS
ncbi:MAG: hypothetical protein ACTSPS_16875, partial [Promethearchaeota archaeon]